MKKNIHPEYKPTRFVCACGNVIETRSTCGGEVKIDICSNCHPFFTGRQKFVDSAGKLERFQKRYQGKGGEASKVALKTSTKGRSSRRTKSSSSASK